jgi:hypothetical protein
MRHARAYLNKAGKSEKMKLASSRVFALEVGGRWEKRTAPRRQKLAGSSFRAGSLATFPVRSHCLQLMRVPLLPS